MRKFAKATMTVITAVMLLVLGAPLVLRAGAFSVPEVDPSSSISALALIAGAVLVFRGWPRSKTTTRTTVFSDDRIA
jgi:hypothetical protein